MGLEESEQKCQRAFGTVPPRALLFFFIMDPDRRLEIGELSM